MAEDDFDDDDFDEIVNQIDEEEKRKNKAPISWSSIQVSPGQTENPVLQRFAKVPFQVSAIPADFQTSPDVGILWLSLKYYNYRRTYIEERVEKLKDTSLKLIVVLLYVDNTNPEDAARTLSVLSCRLNFTLLVAFNLQEAATHIENFKRFANKGPDTLKGKFDETDRVTKLLTIADRFNSSDSASLLRQTRSLAQIAKTNKAEIACISGIGEKKAGALLELLNTPFKKVS